MTGLLQGTPSWVSQTQTLLQTGSLWPLLFLWVWIWTHLVLLKPPQTETGENLLSSDNEWMRVDKYINSALNASQSSWNWCVLLICCLHVQPPAVGVLLQKEMRFPLLIFSSVPSVFHYCYGHVFRSYWALLQTLRYCYLHPR